jgi:hypothetical protein
MDHFESLFPGKHYIAWPECRFLSIRFARGQKEVEANNIKAEAVYGSFNIVCNRSHRNGSLGCYGMANLNVPHLTKYVI